MGVEFAASGVAIAADAVSVAAATGAAAGIAKEGTVAVGLAAA